MVTTKGYPAPLGLMFHGSFFTQGVALGYPISPLRGCCNASTFCFQIPVLHVLTSDSWLLTPAFVSAADLIGFRARRERFFILTPDS